MKKVIKINSIEEYKNKFKSYDEFLKQYSLMICSKEIAEEILGKKLKDKFDTSIRCTYCGCTEFYSTYESDGVGYFNSVNKHGYLKFVEEDYKPSYELVYYTCSNCSYEKITIDCTELESLSVDII